RKCCPPLDHAPTVTGTPGRSGTYSRPPWAAPTTTVLLATIVRATVPSGNATKPASVALTGVTSNPDACGDNKFPEVASAGYHITSPAERATSTRPATSREPTKSKDTSHSRRPRAPINALRLPPIVRVNDAGRSVEVDRPPRYGNATNAPGT